jgi:hypothetical protein
VDSAPIKEALAAAPQACLAVILSRQIFDDVVRQGHVSAPVTDFAKVSVRVKEFQDEAWVKVVGVPHHAAPADDGPANDPPAADRAAPVGPGVHQIFNGDVHGQEITFGISYGSRGNG